MFRYLSLTIFDPSQIPQNIIWIGLSWGLHYILKKFWQRHPIKINKHQIWRKFQWYRIFGHSLSFIVWMYFGNFWKLVRLRIIERQINKILSYHFTAGFGIFKQLEPEMAEYIITNTNYKR